MKKIILVSSLAVAFATPMLSHAESTTTTPAASGATAVGRLDFTVVVPSVLFVRIGTGGGVGAAAVGTIDSLVFTVPATNLGDGSIVLGAGGDLAAGAVTVRVYSNVGNNVSLNSSVTGQLINAFGDTIPWTQIAVVAAPLGSTSTGYTNTGITHPTFSTTIGAGTATTLTAAGKLVRQEGKWTFTYSNSNVVPAGTYGSATGVNNGRVTYTATQV